MDERYQSEIADSVAQLKAENASQRDSTAVLETELNRVKGQLAQAEQAFKTQLGLIQKQHAEELKTLEQNNKHELLVRLAGLDEQYQSEIVDLTAQLAAREESQNATGRELARSTSTVQDVTTELENLKSRHAEQVKTLEQNRQDRIAEMEDQMDRIKWRSKEEIDQLHTENAALQKELKSLQDAISSGRMASDKELELRRQIEILQTDHTEALSNLTNQTADDVSTAEDAKEIERLTSNLRQVNDTLATRDKHIRTLDDKRIELLHLYDRSTRDVADLRKELSSVRSQLDLKTRSILAEGEQKSADNLSHLLREKRELVERVHELEDQLGRNQKHVDALTKSVCDLEDALSTARSDLKGSHTQVSALQGQLAGMGSADQLKDLQRTHANVVMELEFVRRQFDEEVKKEKSGHEKMVKETEKRLAKSQKLLEKALNRISGLEHSESNHDVIVRLHMELAESRKEVADYAQELLESAGREDVMQQNISDLQQEVVMLEKAARCAELEKQMLDCQEQSDAKVTQVVEEMQAEIDRLQAETYKLQRYLLEARKEAGETKLSVSAEKFRAMYVETIRRCSELEKEILVAQEQGNAKTMQAMENMHAELGQVQAENHDLQRDLYEARKEANDSKMLIQQLELRYQEKLRELQDVKDQLRKVRSSVSDFYAPLQKMFDSDSTSA
ncbi:unnamed protein product [Symbiodinium microadriaticum]|nr:unnamed protein product [Symbiodinium microadriaticum]